MSHDWPRGIYHFGDVDGLLRRKRFFAQEIEDGTLGSAPTEELLYHLKPDYWFAAHLHVKFAAIVDHEVITMFHKLASECCNINVINKQELKAQINCKNVTNVP